MFRTFTIAGITAIALAAAPQAEARSNLDNFLIGATALAILGIAASQSKAQTTRTTPYVAPQRYVAPQPQTRYIAPRTVTKHVTIQRKNATVYKDITITRVPKPKHCLRKKWTRDGWVTYYGQQCLANHNR